MKVLKFGGSSVATPERIKAIGSLISERHANREKLTIVFSAFGGVTDQLIDIATSAAKGTEEYQTLFEELKGRHLDACAELGLTEKSITQDITKNFDTLRDLLHGVFLVREASLRTMDYILSFGAKDYQDRQRVWSGLSGPRYNRVIN